MTNEQTLQMGLMWVLAGPSAGHPGWTTSCRWP